jgi:ribose/xylose/arabinose/galactoside ABC-type transport system permease subunit
MTHDDSTVRLPGDRGGPSDLPDRGFGYDRGSGDAFAESGYDTGYGYDQGGGYGSDETTRFDAGYATPYRQPDQTIAIGPEGAAGEDGPVKDRLLVHLIWEILLIVLVAGLAGYVYMVQPRVFSGDGRSALLLSAAVLGFLALGMALSVRAAVPNLAVGGIAVASGVLFAKLHTHGTLTAAGLAIGVALLVGLAIGIVVAVLHVPAWAASLGALVGMVALAHGLSADLINLPGRPYDPAKHATLWFGGFVVLSVLGGLLCLLPPLRRAVGAFRPVADPAVRRGPGAALMALVALVVSAGLAGGAGVLGTLRLHAAGATTDGLLDTMLVLGAVLVGGVSAFGRRGGLLGTALGVFAVSVMIQFAAVKRWNITVAEFLTAAAAVALGLLVTRLVEWGGRPRDESWTG